MTILRRATLVSVAIATLAAGTAAPVRAQRGIDSAFAGLVARLSEPNGYFDSDNIITNEGSYLHVASQLRAVGTHGGVYVGVGPDQNFSYIALVRPSIAFLLDIRRDNLLEHLLFKSLFAMSRNRLEYLCLLFGKRVPADVDRWTGRPIQELIAYLGETRTDSAVAAATRRASNERITAFGVPLDGRDREMIDRYRAQFVAEGLDTRYSSLGRNNRSDYPSFGRLISSRIGPANKSATSPTNRPSSTCAVWRQRIASCPSSATSPAPRPFAQSARTLQSTGWSFRFSISRTSSNISWAAMAVSMPTPRT